MYQIILAFCLMVGFVLSGCVSRAIPVNDADGVAFFAPATDMKLSTLLLTCGKNLNDGDPDSSLMLKENAACIFEINGKQYTRLLKGEVARLDIPAGTFTVNNSSGQDRTKTLQVEPGSVILLVTDENFLPNKGLMFGAVGAVVASAVEAADPDPRSVHNPLTVYKSEKDFMPIVKGKQKVKIEQISK